MKESIPEEEVTNFCLWLKEQTKPYVGKVTISKRLTDVPMIIFGQVSANMRMMMAMMQGQSENPNDFQKELDAVSHNQTLEINTSHPMILKLNKLRKQDEARANKASKQLIDSVLIQSAVPIDM